MSARHKKELDRRTARALGLPIRQVSRITDEFIRQMGELLVEAGAIVVEHLGTFRVYHHKVKWTAALAPGKGRGMTASTETEAAWGRQNKRKVVASSRLWVRFKKAARLKARLDQHYKRGETTMEKYGVDQHTKHTAAELEKLATEGCPLCGKELLKHGSVVMCPDHGTAPFEAKEDGE